METLKKKLTYWEFRQMEFDDDDPYWYELINGELVQKQSPTLEHQGISREIEYALIGFTKRTGAGIIHHAPLDVVLDDGNSYHPDVFYIRAERYFILDKQEKIVIGAPDLVVEILSKSTAAADKGIKKDTYEKYGVREYWLVDPVKQSIEIYALAEERYRLFLYLEGTGILKSSILEGFEMNIEKLFADAAAGL